MIFVGGRRYLASKNVPVQTWMLCLLPTTTLILRGPSRDATLGEHNTASAVTGVATSTEASQTGYATLKPVRLTVLGLKDHTDPPRADVPDDDFSRPGATDHHVFPWQNESST